MSTAELQPAAAETCAPEPHVWVANMRGGEPVHVEICMGCGQINWEGIREQVAALIAAELAKTRAELDEARIAAGVNWDASSHHHREWVRAEHELEQITGVAKALRITVAEMLSGKERTPERSAMWRSTLAHAIAALANPATTAEPADEPKATCSCKWSPVQGRIWCDPCANAEPAAS